MSRALPGGDRNLPRLTSLRFYAALSVFLFHVQRLGIDWAPARLFRWGYTGVTFFFVLSGFVLTWSFGPHIRARTFWRRRAARILPLYVLVTLTTIPLLRSFGERFHPGVLLAHLTLVQAWSPDIHVSYGLNRVSWSLSDEAFFYATFPLVALILFRLSMRQRWLVAGGWLAATGFVSLLLSAQGNSDAVYTNPVLRSSEFVLGVVIALAMRDGWRPRIHAVPLWGSLAFAAAISSFAPGKIVMVLPCAALILKAATLDTDGIQSWLSNRVSIWLGEVSYAFYLVHSLVIRFAADRYDWSRHWSFGPGLAAVLLLFAITLGISAVLHHTVELPMQRLIAGRSSRERTAQVATTSARPA